MPTEFFRLWYRVPNKYGLEICDIYIVHENTTAEFDRIVTGENLNAKLRPQRKI
jgi:hypothetical protein